MKSTQIEMKQVPLIGDDLVIQIRDSVDLTPARQMQIRSAFEERWPDKRFLLVVGMDLSLLSDEDMNAVGWYRKDEKA